MLKTLRDMFRLKDIRGKLLFTFLMLIVIRFGSQLPVPGVNSSYFKDWFDQQSSGAFSFFSAFTGGSFERMSVFALNITPYITSSIIMELLSIAIPALEEMHRDGEDGRKKITTITRYLTIGLSVFESTAMAIGFGRSGLIRNFNFFSVLTVILAMTAGSALVMWIGERITERVSETVSRSCFSSTLSPGFRRICQLSGRSLWQERASRRVFWPRSSLSRSSSLRLF